MIVLVLNSAHSKYPTGNDGWIRASAEAVRSVGRREGAALLLGTDPLSWDCVTSLAARENIPAYLSVRAEESPGGYREYDRLCHEFRFSRDTVRPLFTGWDGTSGDKAGWRDRDRFLVRRAQLIHPVSVRPSGRLDALLAGGVMAHVDASFSVPWERTKRRMRYRIDPGAVRPMPEGDWFVHWTRASQGPWPGERAADFWRDVLATPGRYVRSAGDTLARIFTESRIRASGRHLPSGVRCVAFTACSLTEACALMRWRRRYVQYSFEPWGIAVRRHRLETAGCRPVVYEPLSAGETAGFTHAPGEDGWWLREREWRVNGDFSLRGIPSGDVCAIVPDGVSRRWLRSRLSGDVSIHTMFDTESVVQ